MSCPTYLGVIKMSEPPYLPVQDNGQMLTVVRHANSTPIRTISELAHAVDRYYIIKQSETDHSRTMGLLYIRDCTYLPTCQVVMQFTRARFIPACHSTASLSKCVIP